MFKAISLIVLGTLLSSCGIHQLAEETRDEVKKTNDGITGARGELGTTNDLLRGIKSDTMGRDTFFKMFEKEQTSSLFPPVGLMGLANKFTEAATSEQSLEIFYRLLRDSMQVEDLENGGKLPVHDRLVKYMAAGCIAARISNEKFREIIANQVTNGGGLYENVAYAFAVLRFAFIRDWLIEEKLGALIATNVVAMRETVGHLEAMQEIASLPFVAKLELTVPSLIERKSVKAAIDQVSVVYEDKVEAVDPAEVGVKAIRAAEKFKLENTALQTEEGRALSARLEALQPK